MNMNFAGLTVAVVTGIVGIYGSFAAETRNQWFDLIEARIRKSERVGIYKVPREGDVYAALSSSRTGDVDDEMWAVVQLFA